MTLYLLGPYKVSRLIKPLSQNVSIVCGVLIIIVITKYIEEMIE